MGQDQRRGLSQPYIWVGGSGTVEGFYTLSCCAVSTADLPPEISRQIPYKEAPAILIGRLAVNRERQGAGNGTLLLMNALHECIKLSQDIGATGVIVDAENERARQIYLHFGFLPFPDSQTRLFLPMKTIQGLVEAETETESPAQTPGR